MADDYLDSIMRGELPDELKTVYQHLTMEGFVGVLAVFAQVFCQTHEEVRQRYAPSVPEELYKLDLVRWLAMSIEELHEIALENSEHSSDYARKAFEECIDIQFQMIERLLLTSESSEEPRS